MKTTMKLMMAVLCVTGLACADEGPGGGQQQTQAGNAGACYFASGRPCAEDEVCFGGQDNDCNYYTCNDGHPVGDALGCSQVTSSAAPDPGHEVDCDPRLIEWTSPSGGPTPLPNPCPLGQLRQVSNGLLGNCVISSRCKPWPCDPQFGDEGCPSGMQCDAGSRLCAAPTAPVGPATDPR